VFKAIPKISIITPSFNQGTFIEQTITSILDQNYANLEYVIIDGGSTDNTVEIIKKYNKHITYWISEKDNGQSHAINKGIRLISGEYFNWINSDDYLEKGSLKAISEIIEKEQNVLAICGYCRLFSEENDVSIISRNILSGSVENTLVNPMMNQPSTFYKSEAIKSLGGVNETLHYCMDLELWFRMIAKYGICNVVLTNNLISHFRHHNESKTELFRGKFVSEHNQLIYYLVQELKLPVSIIEFFKTADDNYKSITPWVTSGLNRNKFYYALVERYHHQFFEMENFAALRRALLQLVKYGKIRPNRYYLSLALHALMNK
jgi:glycosyltransferase involved in cell wall biosynthesis